jgi:hypothetical protein
MTEPTKKKPQGFALLSPIERREVATRGGNAAVKNGKTHKFTSEEARLAAIKSQEARRRNKLAQKAAA